MGVLNIQIAPMIIRIPITRKIHQFFTEWVTFEIAFAIILKGLFYQFDK
jgi:hypothetical protein